MKLCPAHEMASEAESLYNGLYDQSISCLQRCLVVLHWRSAVLSPWLKKCAEEPFGSGTAAKQNGNIYSVQVLVKRHRLIYHKTLDCDIQ